MQYDMMFKTKEKSKESGNFTNNINREPLKMVEKSMVELSMVMEVLGAIAHIFNGAGSPKNCTIPTSHTSAKGAATPYWTPLQRCTT